MRKLALVLFALAMAGLAAAECIPFEQAADQVGRKACISGTVVKVSASHSGNVYLDFCRDYRQCPFTVFVPVRSLHNVGDVRQLQGKPVEIFGKVQRYANRAEIVLKDVSQLRGEAGRIPPMPKDFDTERQGNYSAGDFKAPRGGR